MPFTVQTKRQFLNDNDLPSQTDTYIVDALDKQAPVIAAGGSALVAVLYDPANVKVLYIDVDQPNILFTPQNSGTGTDVAFTMQPNSPLLWDDDQPFNPPLAESVEHFLIHNPNAVAVNVNIRIANNNFPT